MWPFKRRRDPHPAWMLDAEFMAWLREAEACDHGTVRVLDADTWREGAPPGSMRGRAVCRCAWRWDGWLMAGAAIREGFANPRDLGRLWFADAAFLDYASLERGEVVTRAARHRYGPSFAETAEKFRHIYAGWDGRMRTLAREKASREKAS